MAHHESHFRPTESRCDAHDMALPLQAGFTKPQCWQSCQHMENPALAFPKPLILTDRRHYSRKKKIALPQNHSIRRDSPVHNKLYFILLTVFFLQGAWYSSQRASNELGTHWWTNPCITFVDEILSPFHSWKNKCPKRANDFPSCRACMSVTELGRFMDYPSAWTTILRPYPFPGLILFSWMVKPRQNSLRTDMSKKSLWHWFKTALKL